MGPCALEPEATVKPRHPVPLNALRAFEAAARCLSFQQAAAQLFVTPAAVSHQVKHLEAYLGVTLFHRSHRSVELTATGEALAASVGELFGQLDLPAGIVLVVTRYVRFRPVLSLFLGHSPTLRLLPDDRYES